MTLTGGIAIMVVATVLAFLVVLVTSHVADASRDSWRHSALTLSPFFWCYSAFEVNEI